MMTKFLVATFGGFLKHNFKLKNMSTQNFDNLIGPVEREGDFLEQYQNLLKYLWFTLFIFQPIQEDLEKAVETLRQKLDESRRLAREAQQQKMAAVQSSKTTSR